MPTGWGAPTRRFRFIHTGHSRWWKVPVLPIASSDGQGRDLYHFPVAFVDL